MASPDGAEWALRPRVDNAMVKALAPVFKWRKMLDEGVHATLKDLAGARRVNATYVSLDGRQRTELKLGALLAGLPLEWKGGGDI